MDDRHSEYRQAILDGLARSGTIRDQDGSAVAGVKAMAKAIDDLPKWLRADVVEQLDIGELEAGRMIADLIETCEELDHLRSYPIEVAWWTGTRLSKGFLKRGTMRATSAKERALYEDQDAAPWWKMDLSLAYWLISDDMERYRLLHHELMHGVVIVGENGEVTGPSTQPHHVEEFPATVGRFGLDNVHQAAMVHNAKVDSQAAARKMVQWAVDAEGQGLLFGAWKGPPKDLADGDVIEMPTSARQVSA